MSMKFVHFDSGTVLIIPIAILDSYFEQPCSPIHFLYGFHITFAFDQGDLEAFGPNQKFVYPFKAFQHVNEICTGNSYNYIIWLFEQPWSPVHRLYGLNICFTFNQGYLEAFGPNQKFENPFEAFKYVNEICPL